MKAPLFLLTFAPYTLFGALSFTTEQFNTALNTSRWFIYDYEDGNFNTLPEWNAVSGGPNPEISTTFRVNNGVSILANQGSSLGTFTGDYVQAGITGIDTDIFVENSANLHSVEFFFLSGDTFYYSDPFTVNIDGWSILQYSFTTDPWYILDDDFIFQEVLITDAILSDVVQIGVDFFPESAAAVGNRVGVDNFTLMGVVPSTPLVIAGGDQISLGFTPEDGFSYTIETNESLDGDNWSNLSTETTNITGTEPFSTTIEKSVRQFLRLIVRPLYYAVPDIGA